MLQYASKLMYCSNILYFKGKSEKLTSILDSEIWVCESLKMSNFYTDITMNEFSPLKLHDKPTTTSYRGKNKILHCKSSSDL